MVDNLLVEYLEMTNTTKQVNGVELLLKKYKNELMDTLEDLMKNIKRYEELVLDKQNKNGLDIWPILDHIKLCHF
jgi:hypothetical protein